VLHAKSAALSAALKEEARPRFDEGATTRQVVSFWAMGKRRPPNLVTVIGSTIGTPTYMAPEQVVSNTVDHRGDLYAVGVVAYEMSGGLLFG
jgi:serine/threonine protein kinase